MFTFRWRNSKTSTRSAGLEMRTGDWDAILIELEKWVRAGEFNRVEKSLAALHLKAVPRTHARAVANVARRINRSRWALRVLNPIVRPEKHSHAPPATELDRIEYAEALRKLGAIDEARTILESVDTSRFPQALLFRSWCFFSEWRYGEALPLLRAYITSVNGDEYARLIGNVNFAAALVHEREFAEAAPLLASLRVATGEKRFALLHGNSLELTAQLAILRGDFESASRCLAEADQALRNAAGVELLWVEKWRAIGDCLSAGRVVAGLSAVSQRARMAGHWETVRHCDLYRAKLNRDADLMNRVFYGTPFADYRRRLLSENADWYHPPPSYLLRGTGPELRQVLDVNNASLYDGREFTPVGQVQHRLLIALAKDAYRPLPLVAAFGQIFPQEHFNVLSSPTRVHQVVRRLRETFRETGIKMEIHEAKGLYRLAPGAGTGISMQRHWPQLDVRHLQFEKVVSLFGRSDFASTDAQEQLASSASTVKRLLRWAVAENKLEVISRGKRTRYRVA